jgi:hypothetical protein
MFKEKEVTCPRVPLVDLFNKDEWH